MKHVNINPNQNDMNKLEQLFKSKQFKTVEKECKILSKKYSKSSILYNILGISQEKQGKLQSAQSNFEKSIKFNPNYIYAYNNLGNVLRNLEKYDDAINFINKAIKLNANYPDAYINLGIIYKNLNKFKKAISYYNKSLELNPNLASAYYNLGIVYRVIGNFDEAILNYKKAISINKKMYEAYSNMIFCSYYKSYDIKDTIAYAKSYRNSLSLISKNLILNYNFSKNPKKLRLGFVSGDFGNHPGGYFMLNTLKSLKNKKFELFAYSTSDRNDNLTESFKKIFNKWNLIEKKDDENVVNIIRKDGIHILFDCMGHTASNRLSIFINKPAPIQVSWLSPGTTGLAEIDYFLGSHYLTPKNEENHFVEKIWRLPKVLQCFTPPNFNLNVSKLPALKNGYITFGSLNNFSKINNEKVYEIWSKILKSIPNSKLILKYKQFDDEELKKNLYKKFNNLEIDQKKIILMGSSRTRKEVFKTYELIDIALDPFPFQGNTTTCEAAWMGVPTLTLKGDRFLFHFGEAINNNLGLHEWIAKNFNEYISKAINFSLNLKKLEKIRQNLRKNALTSPVFNPDCFSEHFEKALFEMWKIYLNKI